MCFDFGCGSILRLPHTEWSVVNHWQHILQMENYLLQHLHSRWVQGQETGPQNIWNGIGIGTARTQVPTTTNYDAGSPTWGDLRRAPLLSAMEVTSLGHGPSWSPIDPIQVSTFPVAAWPILILRTCFFSFVFTPCGTSAPFAQPKIWLATQSHGIMCAALQGHRDNFVFSILS